VVLGVALRLWHVVRGPALWHDEAALVLNVLDLDFADCLGKLLHHEAAPPLFLVLERLTLLGLGDTELALRFPVLLVGCLSLVLFAVVAGRLLPSWPAVLAVGLFAFSDRLVWHSTEAKPYAVDVAVAVFVAWGYVVSRGRPVWLQCLLWLVVLPVAEWLSFPACFVAGGLLLALLPDAIRAGRRDRLVYTALGLAVLGSFVALALGPARAQQDGAMAGCWVDHFADWTRPAHLPVWATAATAEVVRYALMPLGQILLPVAVVGAVRLGRRDGRLLTFLAAPLALSFVAALLGKYPYGGVRVSVFAAPAIIVLVAEGTPACWTWLRRRSRFAPVMLAIALSLPYGRSVYSAAVPWPRIDFREVVAFADGQLGEGDLIASDHWEVLYYMRHRPGRVCDPGEIADRRPARVWIVTGTDPGIAEARVVRVPPAWHRTGECRFPGTVAILFEHQP
jgi:hypothetical protein